MHQLLEQLTVTAAAVTPYLHQQPLRAHRMAGIRQQHLQQTQLELGEPHRFALADAHGVLVEIEADTARRHGSRVLHAGAPQQCTDSGEQGSRAERLGEVVVRSEAERAHQVLLLPAHRQHHDRHPRACTDRFAHLEARERRHIDVEHDQIRRFRGEQAHGR